MNARRAQLPGVPACLPDFWKIPQRCPDLCPADGEAAGSIHLLINLPWVIGIAFILLLLTACVTIKAVPDTPVTQVYLDDENRLHYQGELDEAANRRLFELYAQAEVKPELLVITSGGGDVMLGLDIGDWIIDNHLDVLVEQYCVSSCANYIFTAARRKYLKQHSVLIWHGSSWQRSVDKLHRRGVDRAVQWRQREQAFFEKIGVDYRITVHGFSQYRLWDYIRAMVRRRVIIGFDYSLEDMAKFGVDNIKLLDEHWDWRRHAVMDCCHVLRAAFTPSPQQNHAADNDRA